MSIERKKLPMIGCLSTDLGIELKVESVMVDSILWDRTEGV